MCLILYFNLFWPFLHLSVVVVPSIVVTVLVIMIMIIHQISNMTVKCKFGCSPSSYLSLYLFICIILLYLQCSIIII